MATKYSLAGKVAPVTGVAGATIVNGVERRAPRMIAPAWSTLRGVVNPLFDRYSERDDEIAAAVREGQRNPS